jgi:tetratricopeptide (TPR) repeat protein
MGKVKTFEFSDLTGGAEGGIALGRPLQVLAEAYIAEQRFDKAKAVLVGLERLPEASLRDRAVREGARAWIDANQGRWQDAERHYHAAIGEWEKAGESDTLSVVPELSNLGLLYLNKGRLADAGPLFERAWRITDASSEEPLREPFHSAGYAAGFSSMGISL